MTTNQQIPRGLSAKWAQLTLLCITLLFGCIGSYGQTCSPGNCYQTSFTQYQYYYNLYASNPSGWTYNYYYNGFAVPYLSYYYAGYFMDLYSSFNYAPRGSVKGTGSYYYDYWADVGDTFWNNF